jgi:microsomal dipeptidase-like Zn-dependent dipeptidase
MEYSFDGVIIFGHYWEVVKSGQRAKLEDYATHISYTMKLIIMDT